MPGKKLLYLALLGVGLCSAELYAQNPRVQMLTVSWPNGYQPEYCQIKQSHDFSQLWWVCSNTSLDTNETVSGFVSLKTGQSKPVGFLLSNDQLGKLLNAPPNVYFRVAALTAQGNFLVFYSTDHEERLLLLQFTGIQPKILWNEQLKLSDNYGWLGAAVATANQEFMLLWENSGQLYAGEQEDNQEYNDQAIIQRLGANGHEIWSYRNDNISVLQGQKLMGDELYEVSEYLDSSGLIWQKRLLPTSGGSIVVWGDAYVNTDKNNPTHFQFGEFRTCLNASGQLIKQIVEKYENWMDNQYTQLVAFKNGDWLKIQSVENSAADQEQGVEEFKLVRYNDHCDQMGSQVIQLPTHHRSAQESFHRIKAALMLPTEQLLLVYTQGEDPDSLYVAIIDLEKGVIWDQAIILPDDPDAEWLLSYDTTGRGRDFMEVGLGLLADQKSILVSVSNPAIPDDQDTARYLNKLYQVMLPINPK